MAWLPAPTSRATRSFLQKVIATKPSAYDPSVQALNTLLSSNPVLEFLVRDACAENGNILDSDLADAEAVNVPRKHG